jgi:hypothetical protein
MPNSTLNPPLDPLPFTTLQVRRMGAGVDMSKTVVVFAGLLIAAFAICGAIESRSSINIIDDVKVLNQENVVGPLPIDVFSQCMREHNGSSALCHNDTSIETVSATSRSARD